MERFVHRRLPVDQYECGEAMAGVFTPLSWSIIRKLDEEQYIIPGYYLFSGNICGRMYTNLSMGLSLYPAFGKPVGPLVKRMGDVFGQMPENMTIPIYPFTKLGVLRTMLAADPVSVTTLE
ncbi:hypothetical protein LJK87_37990 [Paenibacillus sp. P25]|nr:hypothetical protein LJK87_37990 [Paenibacillus sp. P25]